MSERLNPQEMDALRELLGDDVPGVAEDDAPEVVGDWPEVPPLGVVLGATVVSHALPGLDRIRDISDEELERRTIEAEAEAEDALLRLHEPGGKHYYRKESDVALARARLAVLRVEAERRRDKAHFRTVVEDEVARRLGKKRAQANSEPAPAKQQKPPAKVRAGDPETKALFRQAADAAARGDMADLVAAMTKARALINQVAAAQTALNRSSGLVAAQVDRYRAEAEAHRAKADAIARGPGFPATPEERALHAARARQAEALAEKAEWDVKRAELEASGARQFAFIAAARDILTGEQFRAIWAAVDAATEKPGDDAP